MSPAYSRTKLDKRVAVWGEGGQREGRKKDPGTMQPPLKQILRRKPDLPG